MLTKKDIDLLVNNFATRIDLQNLEDKMETRFQDVLTKLDAVFKEVLNMRQEQTFYVQKHKDIDQRLDKLEEVTNIFPT